MALIVEDGTGVAGANSFLSTEDANAILTVRGFDSVSDAELVRALDPLSLLDYRGDKFSVAQGLPFPRVDILSDDGTEIAPDVALAIMKNAQVWMSYYINQGYDVSAVATPAVRREKVDVIEQELAVVDGATTAVGVADLPMVAGLIAPLLRGEVPDTDDDTGNFFVQGRTYRA